MIERGMSPKQRLPDTIRIRCCFIGDQGERADRTRGGRLAFVAR